MGPLDQLLALGSDITIAGQTYRTTPLVLTDWAQVENAIRAERRDPIADALALAGGMEPSDRRPFLEQAYQDAKRAKVVSAEELLSYKLSLKGRVHIIWLSLHRHHPDLTQDDVAAMLELMARQVFQQHLEDLRGQFPDLTWDDLLAAAKEKEEGAILEMVMQMEAAPEGNLSPPQRRGQDNDLSTGKESSFT